MTDAIERYKGLITATKANGVVKGFTHNFYRYPARFSHQFVREVIGQFSKPGDHILDPFMGGGTTVVEALSLGRPVTGIDINELAHFVTTVKTTPLSSHDKQDILNWLDNILDIPLLPAGLNRERVRNLPPQIERLLTSWIFCVDDLSKPRQRQFVRCALLKTGQWALDCKTRVPTYAETRAALQANIGEMLQGLDEFTTACHASGIAKNKITRMRNLLCQSTVGIKIYNVLASYPEKPRLVITSPPYPGVHVLYHRWQIHGRRETPAPYWIAGLNDGYPSSYYTFGSRRTELGHEQYFRTLLDTFRSVKRVIHPEATVVQLVAFERIAYHLPRYLD